MEPKVSFRFFDKLKYKIRNKVLIFLSILSRDIKHITKGFFDFQNN